MNEENKHLVSILITCHNYEKFVKQCIQSALLQDYPNIIIAIIDDASTDKSWDIIKETINHCGNEEYIDKDIDGRRVIAIKQNIPLGTSLSRNRLIQETWDADFFMILDADDEIMTSKTSILLYHILNFPNVGLTYADYQILTVSSGLSAVEYKIPYSFARLRHECIVHSGALISKNAIVATMEGDNVFDEKLHLPPSKGKSACIEDYDLFLRISEKFMILHVPIPLSIVRVHGDNSSNMEKMDQEVVKRDFEYMRKKAENRAMNK